MSVDPNESNIEEFESEGPVIRDKRRVDPETGEVREEPDTAAPAPEADADAEAASETEKALAERTADLQRLQAEYVNYRKRVERDREATRQNAVASTLTSLLPVLDDIGRAREHDELHGGFKAVAESFERVVAGLGLEPFGDVGDEFDPRIHDALSHRHSDEVTGAVCEAILQVGYQFGDRLIRPARVAVVESAEEPASSTAAAAEETTDAVEGETDESRTEPADVPSEDADTQQT